MDDQLLAAMEANYRLDYAAADKILDALQQHAEVRPLVDFGRLLTEWWRLTAAVLEEDKAASAPMLAMAEACLRSSEARIKEGDPTGEAHLVKGATLGLMGRWHIKNHHWMKSYFVGKKAKASLEKALLINPLLYDANAGIGIYDYFVAKLPGIVRFIAFTGQKGSPQDGLDRIDIALKHGRYTLVGTRAALALVYIRNETDPTRALDYIDLLLAEYPHSVFFRSLRMIALYDLDRPEDLADEAKLQEKLLKDGEFPSDRAAQVYFTRGLAHFRAQDWAAARTDYKQAVKSGNPSDPFTTWAELHLGNILDITGNRSAAKRQYKHVKKMTNRWGTARLADRYLDDPFSPTAGHMVRLLPD
jgi:tetratricopeptide (TPR) repeat protein